MPNREQTLVNFLEKKTSPHKKLLKEFASYLREQNSKRSIKRSANTDYNIITVVYKYLQTIDGKIENITKVSIDEYLIHYQAKSNIFGKIKHFIVFLYESDRIEESRYKKILTKNYKNGKNTKPKKFAIPFKHWKVIITQLSGVKKFALLLLFYSGIRVGELIWGETTDLIFNKEQNRYIYKVQPKYNEKGELIWYPKTDRSIRDIPLDPSCTPWIEAYLEIRNKNDFEHNYLLYVTKDSAKGFRGDKIKYEANVNVWMKKIVYDTPGLTYSGCNEIVRRTTTGPRSKRIAINIKCTYEKPHRHISPHVTRYSYASHIYYSGRDKGFDVLDEVSKLLGHTDSKTTYTYLQLDKKTETERKIKALDNAFGGN